MQRTQTQTKEQVREMIKDIMQAQKGMVFDAIEAMRFFQTTYGLSFDWHEYSIVLDAMSRSGSADLLPHSQRRIDGQCRYEIK